MSKSWMQERGGLVNYASINRWMWTDNLQVKEAFHRRKQLVRINRHMDGRTSG